MRVDVFGVVYQTKLAKQQIAKEFEMVQEYSSRLSLVKTREVISSKLFSSFSSQSFPIQVGQSEKNQNRNRFVDIIPYDDNYVSLQVTGHTTIISKLFNISDAIEGARSAPVHLCERLLCRRPRGRRKSDCHTGANTRSGELDI